VGGRICGLFASGLKFNLATAGLSARDPLRERGPAANGLAGDYAPELTDGASRL
jgi:hypothetical protein